MSLRQALDAKASNMMLILCVFWGLQQVVLKVAAVDISPLMQLALRSGLFAVMVLPLLLLARNIQWASTAYLPAGILWAATTVAVRLSPLSETPATQTLFYQSSTNHLQATERIAYPN